MKDRCSALAFEGDSTTCSRNPHRGWHMASVDGQVFRWAYDLRDGSKQFWWQAKWVPAWLHNWLSRRAARS